MKQGPQRPENRPIVYPKRPDPRANTLPLNLFAAKQKVGVAISACTIAFSFAVPPLVLVLVLFTSAILPLASYTLSPKFPHSMLAMSSSSTREATS